MISTLIEQGKAYDKDGDVFYSVLSFPGYGQLSPGCLEAIALLARTEGIFIDPTYSGKAMAGLIELKDVKVPLENQLGDTGKGFRYAMNTLDGARIGVAAFLAKERPDFVGR